MTIDPKGVGRVAGALFTFARSPRRFSCRASVTVRVVRVTVDGSVAAGRQDREEGEV